MYRETQNAIKITNTKVYPKVSGLAAWSENCKWCSSLPLGEVVSQSSGFYRHNPLCCFSTSVYCCCLFRYRLSPETFGYTPVNNEIVQKEKVEKIVGKNVRIKETKKQKT
jgi:hypothetical protein